MSGHTSDIAHKSDTHGVQYVEPTSEVMLVRQGEMNITSHVVHWLNIFLPPGDTCPQAGEIYSANVPNDLLYSLLSA